MANYECATRTNYFRVKDEAAFRDLMKRVVVYDDQIEVWEEKDEQDRRVFGFGCYGSIAGLPILDSSEDYDPGEVYDYSYDDFVNELSEVIAEDDAVIILEAGNEKLRYLVYQATVVTSRGVDFCDISTWATESAAKLLGQPKWSPCLMY